MLDQVTVDIASGDKTVQLRATGSVVPSTASSRSTTRARTTTERGRGRHAILPPMRRERGAATAARSRPSSISPSRRRATPRPAWSRSWRSSASAGPRPTPASSTVLQDRNYVRLDKQALHAGGPRPAGHRLPAELLRRATSNTTSPPIWRNSSTTSPAARSTGAQVLREFWEAFSAAVGETKDLRDQRSARRARRGAGPAFLPGQRRWRQDPRVCPSCGNGRLGLKLGKFGAFIGCSNYPECRFTRKLGIVDADADAASGANLDGPKLLGIDPVSGKQVTLRNGPYGLYVQLGEAEGKEKPKRQSLLKGMTPDEVDPREGAGAACRCRASWGRIPRTASRSWPASAASGRTSSTAPSTSRSRPTRACSTIGMNRAVALLAEAKSVGPRPRRQAAAHRRQPSGRRGADRAL